MNGTGHTILFQVALDRMTPRARANVSKLLTENTSNPEEGGWETPTVDSFLPTQAVYPDQWKSYARRNHLPNDEGGLHYENIPIGPNAGSHAAPVVDGGESQLEKQEKIAADKTASPALRANALRWVAHEFGDVGAQPLHLTNYYSDKFPDGDKGGNAFKLNWHGGGKYDDSLHGLMDEGGAHPDPNDPGKSIDNYNYQHLPLSPEDQSFIEQKAKDIEKNHSISLDDPRVQVQDPAEWAKDLSAQADKEVYAMFQPGETVAPNDPRLAKLENLMDGNVALAGARLAAWANANFGGAA